MGCELEGPLWRHTSRYSSMQRTVSAVAWLLRVKRWLQMKAKSRSGGSLLEPIELEAIDGDEYDSAFLTLVGLVQQQAHPRLVEALERFPAQEVFSRKLASVESLPPTYVRVGKRTTAKRCNMSVHLLS